MDCLGNNPSLRGLGNVYNLVIQPDPSLPLFISPHTTLLTMFFPVAGEHLTVRARGTEFWPPIPTEQPCLPPRGFLSVEAVFGGGKS